MSLDEMQARCDAATPGPWDNELNTGAGRVWVYTRGNPLAEPVNPRNWKKGLSKLFEMRRDSVYQRTGGPGDPAWKRVQANAAFIAHARTDMPRLIAALRVAMAALDGIESGANSYPPPRAAREALARVAAILEGK